MCREKEDSIKEFTNGAKEFAENAKKVNKESLRVKRSIDRLILDNPYNPQPTLNGIYNYMHSITSPEKTDAIKHQDLLNEIHNMYVKKNKDYGNSFQDLLDEFGILASVIPLDNKNKRVKSLAKNGTSEVNESIEDSLLDMANYAIMTVLWLRKEKEKGEKHGF